MLKIAWSELYNHPLPEGHRFPMIKYDLIPEQLLYEGTINKENLFAPPSLTDDVVLLTHIKEYWDKLKNGTLSKKEERRTGFPFSPTLVQRENIIMGGTVKAALYALEHGIAMNIAGGTHHAFADKGEGFCLLNDNAIAASYLLSEKLADKILIIDLDVHQGNGTASIFLGKPDVFTFSMHGKNNIFSKRQTSDLDIDLPDNCNDAEYLKILKDALKRITDSFFPDFIFFQSGVDVLKTDKLGKLSLSIRGCKERDRIVLEFAKNNNIPLVASMGGGYSEKITDILEAHCNTYRLAQEIYF